MTKSYLFNIPYKFAAELSERGLHKEFAVWMKLKSLYLKHTIIYDFTYSKAARLSGVSYYTMKKYLQRLEELGWVEFKDGHLLIKAFNKVCGAHSKTSGKIAATPQQTFNQVVDEVYTLLIQRDYFQQKFKIDLTFGRLKATARTQRKLLERYGEKQRENDELILTSSRRIATQSNISQSSAMRLIKRITKKGNIKCKSLIQPLGIKSQYMPAYSTEHGYVFWNMGMLWINRGHQLRVVS